MSDPERRTRLPAETDPQLRGWLFRVSQIHAALKNTVRLYHHPDRAGGQSNEGEAYASRVARGDVTPLHDGLVYAVTATSELLDEVVARMDDQPPTTHMPGTPGKLATLAARADRGVSLFIAGDGALDLR